MWGCTLGSLALGWEDVDEACGSEAILSNTVKSGETEKTETIHFPFLDLNLWDEQVNFFPSRLMKSNGSCTGIIPMEMFLQDVFYTTPWWYYGWYYEETMDESQARCSAEDSRQLRRILCDSDKGETNLCCWRSRKNLRKWELLCIESLHQIHQAVFLITWSFLHMYIIFKVNIHRNKSQNYFSRKPTINFRLLI